MENEINDLSNTLLSIYQKNLQFLKDNFDDIFNRVDTLSTKINNKTYDEKYSLEYVDGYFDIKNIKNNTWYYGCDSYNDADLRSKKSNFTKEGSFNLLRTIGNTNYLAVNKNYAKVLPIVDYINNNIDLNNIEYQKIFKMIFINSGLGMHVNEISKKLKPLTTLIIEPELEIFRLSLFITDYSEFNKSDKKLFLCIEEDYINRQNIYLNFYSHYNYMNYAIKYNLLLECDKYIHNELLEFFSNNYVGFFPYDLVLKNVAKSISFVKNNEYFLDVNKMHKNQILKGKKVLVIAAGPSFI